MANRKEDEGVLLNISEMIDLAIGTPEIGVVDFCMLQTVLHCLAQQLRVLDKNVELRGSISVLPVGRQPSDAQTIYVNELLVETDGGATHPDDQDTMLIVERVQKDERPGHGYAGPGAGAGARAGAGAGGGSGGAKSAKQASSKTGGGGTLTSKEEMAGAGTVSETSAGGGPGGGAGGGTGPGPGVSASGVHGAKTPSDSKTTAVSSTTSTTRPHTAASYEKLSLVTLSKFNLLENAVEDLKNRVYGSIPKNEDILEEVRSQTNLKAITDMWTNLNVSSRLEAAEEGIAKLSSLLQDVIGDTAELQKNTQTQFPSKMATSTVAGPGISTTQKQPGATSVTGPSEGTTGESMTQPRGVTEPSGNIIFTSSMGTQGQSSYDFINKDLFATKEELLQLYNILESFKEDHDWLSNAFVKAMHDMKYEIENPPPQTPMPSKPKISEATLALMRQAAAGADAGGGPADTGLSTYQLSGIQNKLEELEDKIKLCNDVVFSPNGNVQELIDSLQDQIEEIHKLSPITPLDAKGKASSDIATDLQALTQLFQTVQLMQSQLQQVHETAVQLASEKEDRQHNINSLLEQIELLKSIKLDREDMVEALADKADLRMLARKVSHDQFELACDDLSRGLEHALGKLNVQESLWQQALDDIQREIESKLDKVELSPVKEFFNNKLKQLQENLKQMAELRREAQAAGTKRRLLRDVNCISCDAKAIMDMDEIGALPSKPLPPTMSMKPYLSYELDAIRKAQASSLPQRNLHDWENVTKQMTTPRQPQKVRSETDKHICNRYCGGSHTTTTPAQRVARLGHFIKQWGPEVLPLSSAYATGDDGRLYKVTATEGVAVGPGGATDVPCTPKSPTKKEGRHISKTPKPTGITPECRCLEERPPKN